MENVNEKEGFSYTYSAKQQMEIKNIRQRYMPKEVDKMEQLRKLDQSATQKGVAVSIAVGVVGALLLGIGMCCTMVWAGMWFVPGIIVGGFGIAIIAMAYPLYHYSIQKEREKIAPEILRLSDELLK
ncbi:MAG: hypothetical protein IJ409_08665 [Lachnospiraceae bacterium]|nr:hypothetical protein [Lachnospiraceae bacterium]